MNYIALTKTSLKNWSADKASTWASSLAYFTVFSLSPLLLLIIAATGFFFGEQAVQGKLFAEIQGTLGRESAGLIQQAVSHTAKPSGNIIATIIGFVTLLLGATGVFGQIQEAFNAIWKVKPDPKAGIKNLFKNKILSFSMLLIIGFLVAISIGVSFFINLASQFFSSYIPIPLTALQIGNTIISFFVLALLFAAMFKYLPNAKIPFKAVIPGAFLTALLFVIGKFVLGWYIGHAAYTSTYGAAGALLIILVWVYYSGQILFLGAEFTKAYALERNIKIVPSENAVATVVSPKKIREKAEPDQDDKSAALVGYAVLGAAKKAAYTLKKRKRKKKSR